jgi:hypothetical protein
MESFVEGESYCRRRRLKGEPMGRKDIFADASGRLNFEKSHKRFSSDEADDIDEVTKILDLFCS